MCKRAAVCFAGSSGSLITILLLHSEGSMGSSMYCIRRAVLSKSFSSSETVMRPSGITHRLPLAMLRSDDRDAAAREQEGKSSQVSRSNGARQDHFKSIQSYEMNIVN